MKRKKSFFYRHGYTLLFSLALTLLTGYVLLDTFVLPRAGTSVATASAASTADIQTIQSIESVPESSIDTVDDANADTNVDATAEGLDSAGTAVQTSAVGADASSETIVTDNVYSGNGISIVITTVRISNTTAYVANVQLTSANSLQTALAQNTFGSNITQTTSEMASENSAILAINGDYYGANKRGYVIKNGVLYRDTVRQGATRRISRSMRTAVSLSWTRPKYPRRNCLTAAWFNSLHSALR